MVQNVVKTIGKDALQQITDKNDEEEDFDRELQWTIDNASEKKMMVTETLK